MKSKTDYLTTPSKSDEHYTSDDILEVARKLMDVDAFDLDVANTEDNHTESVRYYAESNSALLSSNSWKSSSLWCNPPFSKNLEFSMKLNEELVKGNISKAVYLSKIDSRTQWWRNLTANSDWLIVKNGCVRFGNSNTAAPFGIVLHCYGLDKQTVLSVCSSEPALVTKVAPEYTPMFKHSSLEEYLQKEVRFKSSRKIADIFGVSPRSVTQTAHQLGLKTRRKSIRDGAIIRKQTLILTAD